MAAYIRDDKEMSIWDHIGELRKRLLVVMGALVLGVGASFFGLATTFIDWLAIPGGGIENFVAIEVTESFSVFMRISLLSGFIMALPIVVWQILAFVVPGLYDNEKRWVFLAIPIATLLFVSGVAFSYFVMLPVAIPFMAGFLDVRAMWRLANYINFVTNMMFWIGMSFEMPLVIFMMAKFNVVNWRMLLAQWRFAIVIIAVLAAMITPTVDPASMGLLMVPLFIIYLLSVLFAFFARPKPE